MATYVIGDIHGCFQTFQNLLARIEFTPRQDRLWLVGDLVNRGPRSLEVLRWVRERERQVVVVLGNHDLHLLACAFGVAPPREKDTLGPVLQAEGREDLLGWLRRASAGACRPVAPMGSGRGFGAQSRRCPCLTRK
ncbi:MAG TPA: metallophosphoesterase [Candidatus Binatia bacterium]|nr:metallophosphoesterase [Candidatus Binatia bacterium]